MCDVVVVVIARSEWLRMILVPLLSISLFVML